MTQLEQSQDGLAPFARPAAALGVRLSEARDYDRQRAMRTLLQQPLFSLMGLMPLSSGWYVSTPSGYAIGSHRNTGWALQVDSELARLRKTPADLADDTRAARDGKTGVPLPGGVMSSCALRWRRWSDPIARRLLASWRTTLSDS